MLERRSNASVSLSNVSPRLVDVQNWFTNAFHGVQNWYAKPWNTFVELMNAFVECRNTFMKL